MSESKIKVLFAIPRFSVGGAEKFLAHHLKNINRSNYQPALVTLFDEQKDSCADQVKIDRCFHFRSTWDISAFFRLLRYLRDEKFDVVVTHLFSANLLVRAAAIFAGARIIIAYEHNIYPNKRRWQIFMDWLLSKWTARIIVDSEAAKMFTAKQESISIEKFVTIFIPPLLDERERRAPAQLRAELGIRDGAQVVVTVSRLVIDKGHTYLIDAAVQVLKTHPDAYFLIGGWGPLKEKLEAQVKKLGVGSRVRLLGRVDGQEYLALADVYVDPAISTDLPVGIIEAMREGKAIVATEVGEIPLFIQNDKTGLIVRPANLSDLASAIKKMLDDSELRRRVGAAAKAKVADFSMENYMRTFDNLVDSLLPA